MTKRAHAIQDTETQKRLLRSLDGIDGRGDGRRDADGVWLADAFDVRERKVGYPGGRAGKKRKGSAGVVVGDSRRRRRDDDWVDVRTAR